MPGKSRVPGAAKIHKLSSNKSPLGPSPKAIDAFRACASDLALYPDGSVVGAPRGDWSALRARSGANHLRQWVGRVAGVARACVSGSRRRRTLQRIWFSRISHLHSSGRRDAGRRERNGQDGECRRDARESERAHENRLSRQSRTTRPGLTSRSPRSSVCRWDCRRTRYW